LNLQLLNIFFHFFLLTWNACILHKSAAMFRYESQINRKRRFVVDDAADSMHAVCVQLLRFKPVNAVLIEQLRPIRVIDFIELSFGGKRHKNNLKVQGWNLIACLLSAKKHSFTILPVDSPTLIERIVLSPSPFQCC
jgi:hypothetical protein